MSECKENIENARQVFFFIIKWEKVGKCGKKWEEGGGEMFLGEFQHSIDAKGRVSLPAKFRDGLGEKFYVTKGLEECLFIFSEDEWTTFSDRLKQLSLAKKEARAFVRFFFGGAAEIECDKQGRMLLPASLREYAGCKKELVIVGVGSRIEVWDQERWNNYNDGMIPEVTEIAEQLVELGF